jgi:hypothetical protein
MTDIETYTETAIFHAALALQWTATDATEVGNGYPIGDSGDEYTDEIVAKVPYLTEAVTAFIADNWEDVSGLDASQTGHDIILTANGHGAGFWDRGLGARGDRLTEASKPYGSLDSEFALWGDYADDDLHCADEVAYLCVMNEIIVDDGMISRYDHDTREAN